MLQSKSVRKLHRGGNDKKARVKKAIRIINYAKRVKKGNALGVLFIEDFSDLKGPCFLKRIKPLS